MEIINAKYLEYPIIEVTFDNGERRTANFTKFLHESQLQQVRKWAEPEMFAQFRIENGTLCWGENEMDINPENIYNNKYSI